ncbi:MAG: hypothetical protein M3238_06140, partial [Actinomycetota bacterium]|nr:hypothetical protein [Actinomycetota bacterium]
MTPEDRMRKLMNGTRPGDVTEAEWHLFLTKAHRSLALQRVAVVSGVIALVAVVAFGGRALLQETNTPPIQPGVPSESTTAEETPSQRPEPQITIGNAGEPGLTTVQQWFVRGEDLTLEHVGVAPPESIGRATMEALLFGPSGPAKEDGVDTTIPFGTELL